MTAQPDPRDVHIALLEAEARYTIQVAGRQALVHLN